VIFDSYFAAARKVLFGHQGIPCYGAASLKPIRENSMAFEDLLHPFLSSYTASPQWFKNSVGRTYSLIPVGWRRGRHYEKYLNEAALTDEFKIRQLAAEKLAATLRWALQAVPAYRQYHSLLSQLDEPFQVLQQLPLVSKEDIKQDISRFLALGIDPRLRMKVFTGGSTSTPMTFYLQKGITRTKEYAFMENFHQRAQLSQEDVILALRGRTVPTAKQPGGPLWMYEPIKRQLILSSDHLAPPYMADYVEAIRTWKPSHIQAYPSALYPLALWLKEHPAPDVSQRIKSIMLFSENVYDHHLALLHEVFSCPVLNHYGHSERLLMAATMPDDERYFFWPQYGHFELVDDTGNPITEPGVLGEIVGTGFDNKVMPLIRYRTGDMAILGDKPHPLLPGFPVVQRIEGRRQEFIVCNDGRLISTNALGVPKYDDLEGVEAIQFEQMEPGHIRLNIATPTPLSPEARRSIVKNLEAKTQGGCTAEVVEVRAIPRTMSGKLQMLVQHLDINDYFGAPVKQDTILPD
jgi:phenylacetate-CoA ligase